GQGMRAGGHRKSIEVERPLGNGYGRAFPLISPCNTDHMKLFAAFLRLIRSVNLLFIVLTQALFQYAIVVPMFSEVSLSPALSFTSFSLLCLSSVLIAAAGYIINDYFDLNID